MTYPKVCLRRGEETGVRAGKPWIFENQLDWADDVCKDGGIVDVLDSRMRFAARGYFNSKSKITVRVLTRDENEVIDRDFFRRRIERAWSVRRMLGFENSCRVVFGESDGLPGLTVDKFADCLSFQIVSRGMERWKDDIVAILTELFQPRGIYELRATVQASEEPYELTYGLWQKDASGESQLGENVTVVSAASTETESLKEMDVAKEVKEDAALFVKVTTNSSSPVAFVLHAEALTPLGRHRVLIGSIILIAVYVLLLLEVINRAVVAFIGAFLTLLLITFTSHAPALATVVGWMDSSTLCLLFGMMIMVQMLSTTGMFEYLAVMMLTLTKGNVLHLNMALCLPCPHHRSESGNRRLYDGDRTVWIRGISGPPDPG